MYIFPQCVFGRVAVFRPNRAFGSCVFPSREGHFSALLDMNNTFVKMGVNAYKTREKNPRRFLGVLGGLYVDDFFRFFGRFFCKVAVFFRKLRSLAGKTPAGGKNGVSVPIRHRQIRIPRRGPPEPRKPSSGLRHRSLGFCLFKKNLNSNSF